MAKRKKKRSSGRNKGSKSRASSGRNNNKGRSTPGVRWLDKQMAKVQRLLQAKAHQEAFELLLKVVEKYPRDSLVLDTLINVGMELKNWRTVITYSERLYPLERGDDRATTLNNLMAAYLQLQLPALAWKTGSILLDNHPHFQSIGPVKNLVEKLEPMLFEGFTQTEMLAERFDGDRTQMLDFMVEHDQMRFFAENGQSVETILSCRRLLEKIPGFIAALNNVSLAYFMEGDLQTAIEMTQQVLAQEPENFHGLSNMIRYSFLMGEMDTAWAYAAQFKNLVDDSPDRWLKQAETLSYLGDDEAVKAAYLEAEQHEWLKSPLLLHLAAAAHYRLGDEAKAWRLWEEAVLLDPSFYMARASLADRAKEPHERDVPWYWPLGYWFGGQFQTSLEKLLLKGERQGRVKHAIQRFLKEYPQLPVLAPHILDRGDPMTRKLMLSLIQMTEMPELLSALLTFGLSRHGPDTQRMEALQFLAANHAELLPPDRKVSLWLKGKQKEILFLTFQIYSEPEVTTLDDETYELFMEGHKCLSETREFKRAEQLFMEVAKAYPDYPAAYNQLAVAYEMQGRDQEARTLITKTHHRFPDYTFARIGLARIHLEEKRTDEARELLNPVLQQTELHVSEFRTLAQAEMMFALTIESKESARVWLDMWQKVEEDHPDIPKWKARIEGKKSSEKRSKVVRRMLREFGL